MPMNIDSRKEEVKLEALSLPVECSMMAHCPFCGAMHEKSLSISRTYDGLVYNCFRASCGASGFIGSKAECNTPKKRKKQFKPYTGRVAYYPFEPIPFLEDRFDIHTDMLREVGIVDELNFLLPVHSINSKGKAGNQLRYFDGTEPKAVLYPEQEGPYYQHIASPYSAFAYAGKPSIVIVEDYFSMLKVQQNAYSKVFAMSIMGTHISEEMALWIGKHSSRVVLMLDPDAVNKSFKFKKLYSLLWPECKIVQLDEDPKDTPNSVLKELLTYM